ncbi:hypothetical protein H5203_21005 [Pseudoalteromonas sp. SG41-1]|uniref:hypothetical protein n=1 Tax=Pseudoalteromonas sp. SG41-1 TaxID=2760979 RepID=UPI001602EE7C|nr:hypothetical protein [Pseudoalteromonas sp. SG41-1]MBB1507927.1 hypothetical protein [Pseudoalteromonas sp. SG41-1]
MENNKATFPTIGELVREIFNITGLLAQKDRSNSFLSESNKKKLQTKLKRLADESSKIDGKLEELIDSLRLLLESALGEERVIFMVLEAVEELLVTYKSVLADDGTYLNKRNSSKWFIQQYLLDRILLSFYKNYLKINVPASKLNLPNLKVWALPDIEGQNVNWPLRKAWQLIYESLSISQSSFHYPDKSVDDYRANQNLENAQHWSTTDQIPSISSLFNNLEYSLSLLECPSNDSLRRLLSKSERQRLKIILFIGRVSSYCFRELESNFGREFLISCIDHVKGQSSRLYRINSKLDKSIKGLKKSTGLTSEVDINRLYFYEVSRYWEHYALDIGHGTKVLQSYIARESFSNLTELEKSKLVIAHVGTFAGHGVLTLLGMTPSVKGMPSEFPELFCEGLKLKKSPTSLGYIDNYHNRLRKAGLDDVLSWLVNWCYANYFYTHKSFDKSYGYYEKAFNQAKYSAGCNQYLLVNQYIESCAKNGKYKEMKKAVAWAQYLGIKIRWLRGWDDPESEASLKGLYELMGNQNMQYAQL